MPNSQQHRDKANHNRAALNSLDLGVCPDWVAVVAFYTAVHLVERLRTRQPKSSDQHSVDHQDRLQFVQSHHRSILTDYRELFNASLIARYETLNSFTIKYSQSDVRNVLVDRCLVVIEQYVAKIFAPPPAPSPSSGAAGS
jgi:hypothetical protein